MQCELEMQRLCVDPGIDIATGNQRLGIGCETQPAIVKRKVEGLDAETVPGHETALLFSIPDDEGKHAMQVLGTALSPLTVGFQDDLAVTVREEAVALLAQFGAQFTVVVDSPVENQDEVEFVVDHRLVGFFGEIDDRQATVPEADRAIDEKTGIIRATPLETAVHAIKQGTFDSSAVKAHFTTDSTHRRDQPQSQVMPS